MTSESRTKDDGEGIDLPTLRDIVYIWLYLTMTRFGDISEKKVTEAQLQDELTNCQPNAPHVNMANQNVSNALDSIYLAIQADHNSAFKNVRSAFMTIPYLNTNTPRHPLWPGGAGIQHPALDELDSIFAKF